ncbi:MAG: fibronectin type III domain-containing protein [Bacteroidales bacterium]|nr:fibronectin type III domain-containing protein [Bacteroidales bacterium]
MKRMSVFLLLFLWGALLLPWCVRSQEMVYSCNFDQPTDTAGWVLLNGSQPNRWRIGTDNTMSSNAMYITNVSTTVNYYNYELPSEVFAYRRLELRAGDYRISYDWRCVGERRYDFFRVFLVPDSVPIEVDGVPWLRSILMRPPEGWIALDSGMNSSGSSSWQQMTADGVVAVSGTYKLLFGWCNDESVGTQPPVAVDNVVVERQACAPPVLSYIEQLTPTSFTLHWRDLNEGNSSQWLVELDSAAQSSGGGTLYNAYDTMITFMGLQPNTDYTVYVRVICGYDTLETAMEVQIHTPCEYITSLPYIQDFEVLDYDSLTGTLDVPCWSLSGANVFRVEGTNSSGGLGIAFGQGGYVLLPNVDLGLLNLSDMQLSFQFRKYNVDELVVEVGVMSDRLDIGTFEPVDTVFVNNTEWTRHLVEFANYSGVGGIVALRVVDGGRVCVDDVELDYIAACQAVEHLTVAHCGTTGALVEWQVMESALHQPDSIEVVVAHAVPGWPSSGGGHYMTAERHILLTGLESGSDYVVRVRVRCTNDSVSGWDSVRLSTLVLPCVRPDSSTTDSVVCGVGTNHVDGVPVHYSNRYTLCQSIYTAEELHDMGLTAGLVVGMDYTFTSNRSDCVFSIYLTATDRTTYANVTDMVEVVEADLALGSAAHPTGTVGKVRYAFSHPFLWDGLSNIAVTTMMNAASMMSSAPQFYGNSTQTSSYVTLSRGQNVASYTLGNYLLSYAERSTYRPSVTFHTMGCAEVSACGSPLLWVRAAEQYAAELEWVAGSGETSWSVCCRGEGDTLWRVADTQVTGNSYRLDGLEPSRRYEVRLEHVCGGDTLYGQCSFVTACTPVDTLPWEEDFEQMLMPEGDGEIAPCWYRRSSSNVYVPHVSENYSYEGARSLCIRSTSRGYSYVVLPAMGADLSALQVSFYTYATRNYRLRVGVMTNPSDTGSFEELAVVTPTRLGVWDSVELTLDQYVGIGKNIALMILGEQQVFVDNLRVDYHPSCLRPRNVTVVGVTQTTATLRWQGVSAMGYEIEYGPEGFVRGTGSVVSSMCDSVVLTGLTHSRHYEVYVRSICDTADTSDWSLGVSLFTDCGMIDSLPYITTFDDGAMILDGQPACWDCFGSSHRTRPHIVDITDGGRHVVGHALHLGSEQIVGSYAAAVMPPIDTLALSLSRLQVVVKASGARLIVGLSSSDDAPFSFTPVDTLALTGEPMVYEVPLDAASGAYNRIIFVSNAYDIGYVTNSVKIYSVAIELAPTCPRPRGLRVLSSTTTTADLAWQGGGGGTAWQVEVVPHGAAPGSGIRFLSGTPNLTVTGLAPSGYYDFYVRSICGAGDTSQWCHNPIPFVTQQFPATVPYFCAFDSLAEWGNWQRLSNEVAGWCWGMADGSPAPAMYVSADSGSSRGSHVYEMVNAVAYRDIDFGNVDTSYVLSFSADMIGEAGEDLLSVFLVDPTVMPAMPTYNRHLTPWGLLDTMVRIATFNRSSSWDGCSFVLDGLRGVHRLVFYWYNRSLYMRGRPYAGLPAAVDNVSVRFNPCPPPEELRASRVTASSATIEWQGAADGDYRAVLYSSRGELLSDDTVHTNRVFFSGLASATSYRLDVSRLCDSATEVGAPSFVFATDVCTDGVSDTVDGGAWRSIVSSVPFYSGHPYSYTQQLVLASELGGAGEITAINFCYLGGRTMRDKTNCTIYMGHTSLSSFPSVSDYVDPLALVPVYIGSLNCLKQWNRIFLDRPFAYNGSDNLVVAIDDNSGEALPASYQFLANYEAWSMTLSFFSDSADIDCSSSSTLGSFGGERRVQNYRAVMSFDFCPPNSCQPPLLLEPEVRTDYVVLRWRNTAERYMVGYRVRSSSEWVENHVLTTDTFYTIGQQLLYDTDYVYHVRQFCDVDNVSNWAFGTFNTADIPCLPPRDVRVAGVTHRSARLTWSPEGNNISYRVHVWGASYDTFFVTYLAGGRVNGLSANTRYYASVEVVCEYHDSPSRWSDTVSFVTDYCPDVAGLAALEVGGNSVLLDWADEGEVERWMIEWGPVGFEEGTGVRVMADHHPFLVTGLTGETSYDIYVRSVCGADFFSDGWGFVSVTTQYSDVGSVTDDARVTLSPNPTRGGVVLALPGRCSAAVRVEVVDGLGRVRYSEVLPAGTTKATLPTSQLGQGIYIVRLAGGEFNAVKRLVVE